MVCWAHGLSESYASIFGVMGCLGPGMSTPMFHEDNQATILVTMSGRNPTMRHLGRVHCVDVSWLHERLGKHARRDPMLLFYEDTTDTRADV